MVESVCRRLRDGLLPGEFAPALMLLNRSSSPHTGRALLLHLLASLSSSVAAGKAQPGYIVVVAADCSPKYYQSFPGFKEDQLLRFRYVDCFVDPLGWRLLLSRHQVLEEAEENLPYSKVCHDLRNLGNLLSFICQAETLATSDAVQFSIVIDSVSALLAYNSLDSIAKFLDHLRANGKVSSLIWMLHSDLHNSNVVKSLEYVSSMIITVEQCHTVLARKAEETSQSTPAMKPFCEGILKVRQKRPNGRVREEIEKFEVEGLSINISKNIENIDPGKTIVPKVQFRLQLSEMERQERAKVILPFEHQGNGQESLLYNGRPDATATDEVSVDLQRLAVDKRNSGLVEYLRDSEDERPDSDEDPDDDLDI